MRLYDALPEPTFTADQNYSMETTDEQLAACAATLRSIAIIPQAYYSQGPEFIVRQIETVTKQTLDQLANKRRGQQ